MEIERKDISELKEFKKYGDTFRQIRNNAETGWWLYERATHYEVVKGRKHKNASGEVVYVYPSESEWGQNGYTIPKCWWAEKTIDFILGKKIITPQELYEFKKTLKYAPISSTVKEIREF